MGDPLAVRAWYGGLVTNITGPVDLATLVRDLYAGLPAPILISDITASELKLLAAAGNAVNILIGDEQISTTNYGDTLAAGGRTSWGPYNMSKIPLSSIFVMPADGATVVSLGIQAFEG